MTLQSVGSLHDNSETVELTETQRGGGLRSCNTSHSSVDTITNKACDSRGFVTKKEGLEPKYAI